jgi:dihydroorotate dehydrogenase (fumarate)
MDLTTKYMGMTLKNSLVPSSSPLTNDVDNVKRIEDAGASAIVMHSLFEEQILHESRAIDTFLTQGTESFAEAMSYFPEPEEYHNLDAEEYLTQISKIKDAVDIPVIGSLNGVSSGGWMKYAKNIEEAGADGLELNIYFIPTDPKMTGSEVEELYVENLKTVKDSVKIPVAMKLNPNFSAFSNMAARLDEAGADALVLFNRFYQPDIDLDSLDVVPNLHFSSAHELRLPLRWLAILYSNVKASLAGTTGVHKAEDAIKLLLAGADVTMMTSVLLKQGIDALGQILTELKNWMEQKEYDSVEQMKGSMSYQNIGEPAAYTRANYMKVLQSIK